MNEDASIEDMPTSVPANTQIRLIGVPDDQALLSKVGEAIGYITSNCGRYMDLSILDGITVGWNYDEALQAVDLGYESSVAKSYTNTADLIGVAKTLRVRRGDAIKAHVVYNANALSYLSDHEHPNFLPTLNLVAHELGHVCAIAWFDQHSPRIMLEPFKGDWLRGQLLDAAHTCWEEYAACRLASVFHHPIVEEELLKTATQQSSGVFAKAHAFIKAYRFHGDLHKAIFEVSSVVLNAVKYSSYYLGHINGLNSGSISLAENEAFGDLSPFVEDIQRELQNAWNTRYEWDGLNGLNGLLNVTMDILSATGMVVTLDNKENGQLSRVDFPFSPQTLPGGEDTYRLMKKQNLL